MACLETKLANHQDSEREEGEIVDDIDVLSDISSEEEFLLRERLAVLENYNNVLERKKAKDSTISSDVSCKTSDKLYDLSELSASAANEFHLRNKNMKVQKHKSRKRPSRKSSRDVQKIKKDLIRSNKAKPQIDIKRKTFNSRRLPLKIISESSEESEDEYRNKRRKLADAIAVTKSKHDPSSLKARLKKIFFPSNINRDVENETQLLKYNNENYEIISVANSPEVHPTIILDDLKNSIKSVQLNESKYVSENNFVTIDLCLDETCTIVTPGETNKDESIKEQSENVSSKIEDTSDDDLEQLRQHALKTKPIKLVPESNMEPEKQSDNEDSDTRELRLICLKSAILKKAIEMKMKQKKKKRLSQTLTLQDDLLADLEVVSNKPESNNNTDIESVDMDIGSDVDEKPKDNCNINDNSNSNNEELHDTNRFTMNIPTDELDEDEDLLRAKLLTSLSKNLPNLVDPQIVSYESPEKPVPKPEAKEKVLNIPEPKKLVINFGGSDSEAEHEATKNLTKMHAKLSTEFQQNLDTFLKSTRKKVETKLKLPDVVQPDPVPVAVPNAPKKFVAKVVSNLPKSEQIEYKKLVKRMDELEKIKQMRQSSVSMLKKGPQLTETLKPRNVTIENNYANQNLEEQIALSRKNIAEESARMLKLKDEGTKLSQKYKIVATELRNLATAINLNKKEQRTAQNKLSKIRNKHQMLIKSTNTKEHPKNGHVPSSEYIGPPAKLQKENDPSKKEYKNPQILKSVKVSVVNDRQEEVPPSSRISIAVDVTSNKKTVTVPKKLENIDLKQTSNIGHNERLQDVETSSEKDRHVLNRNKTDNEVALDEYISPLQALGKVSWEGDPNNILCPFEFGGNCKDVDCIYEHSQIPSK